MSLNWFGNTDWYSDRCPETQVPVYCPTCDKNDTWIVPMNYHGPAPKHPCGGTVQIRQKVEASHD